MLVSNDWSDCVLLKFVLALSESPEVVLAIDASILARGEKNTHTQMVSLKYQTLMYSTLKYFFDVHDVSVLFKHFVLLCCVLCNETTTLAQC